MKYSVYVNVILKTSVYNLLKRISNLHETSDSGT